MRIGIDGYNLAMPQGTGVATYARTLAHALATGGHRPEGVFGISAGRDPTARETIFFDRFGRGSAKPTGARLLPAYLPWLAMRAAEVPAGVVDRRALGDRWPPFERVVTAPDLFARAHRHFATYGRFVPLAMADPPAIMHWTYPVPVELVGARNIYTLHDLVPLTLPFATTTAKHTYHRLITRCAARAARLCTVSEASRQEILHTLRLADDRVVNCSQAVMPQADDASDEEAARAVAQALGLERDRYFLFFGAIEPKKNLGRLIEAHLSRATETPLVIVGSQGWSAANETALLHPPASLGSAHAERLSARVVQLDHLPRLLLMRLVRGAKAVAFPSIAEGFGLPAAEAMRLGTPVLTANCGALAEVAGDAALLVDPFDVRAIAAGLDALDRDPALRARLRAAGPIQAARFTPERFLEKLERLYDAVLGEAPLTR